MTTNRATLLLTMLAACGGGMTTPDVIGAPADAAVVSDGPVGDHDAQGSADAKPPPDAPEPVDAGPPPPDADLGVLGAATIGGYMESAICTWWVRCGLVPDGATCVAAFDPAVTQIPQLIAYEAAGRLTFDLAAAMTCLDDTSNQSCSFFDATPPPSCDGVFTGSVPDGGACIVNEECLGDSVCVQPVCEAECCTGECTPPPAPAALGGDCAEVPCDASGWCDGGHCAPRGTPGDPCTTFGGCQAGSFCKLDFTTGNGLCAVLVDRGDACDPTVVYPSGGCRRFDDWCNPTSGLCERRLSAGDSCATAPADRCLPYATCVAGVCAERPGLGDACGATPCLGQLVCSTAACVLPDPAEVCP